MNNNKRLLALSGIAAICFSISGCGNATENEGSNSAEIVLNVYNCAEYINEDVLEMFEQECLENYNQKVTISYATYETNEDLYNQLKAGGVAYDLVCPSDYMIEKMIINDMLEPITNKSSNYDEFGSTYIHDVFDGIEATSSATNTTYKFSDYAVPYMWGTMGFMYDPEPTDKDGNIIEQYANIDEDVRSWDILWDEQYKNKTSLKDSIRDSYAIAVLHTYKSELELAKKLIGATLADGTLFTIEDYNEILTEVMNRCDDETLGKVESVLKEAKENVYEFEVDTGKEHIVKGDYYVNLCWSGDAVYALDLAEEEDVYLNYVVPEEGSNVWFDGWVMPKNTKHPENKVWAERLMDFFCRPDIAAMNMDEVGYTSAIAGQDMWELVQDWYNACDDNDEYILEATEDNGLTAYDLTYFFKGTEIKDEDGNLITSFVIYTEEEDRQLYAQYSTYETLQRCGIMKDFGTQADAVSEMWIRAKGNSVSWIVFVFLGVIVALVGYVEFRRAINKRARKNRAKLK